MRFVGEIFCRVTYKWKRGGWGFLVCIYHEMWSSLMPFIFNKKHTAQFIINKYLFWYKLANIKFLILNIYLFMQEIDEEGIDMKKLCL